MRIGNLQIRADLRVLLLDRPHAVRRALDLLFDKARSDRVLIAVDEAHQLGFSRVGPVGIHMELDDVARTRGDLVGVTKELDLCHLPIPVTASLRPCAPRLR